MSIYTIFAQNLREECRRFESIAAVCRDSGINRQQFNKYLSGTTIPNARTLEKLCTFLGVESAQMFLSTEYKSIIQTLNFQKPKPTLQEITRSRFLQSFNAKHNLPEYTLPSKDFGEGYYNCYFPLEGTTNFLVRSILKTKIVENEMSFVRHTRMMSPSNKLEHLAFGKHHGLVIDDSTSLVLLGRNLFPPYNVSSIYLRKGPMYGLRTSMGLAFILGMASPYASRVCIESIGSSNAAAKRALKEIGIVPARHPTVSDAISRYLTQDIETKSAMLGLPQPDQILKFKNQV
jgi:transcriptional regulator with XRE-family HTH domain